MNPRMTYLNFHTHRLSHTQDETPVINLSTACPIDSDFKEWYTTGIHPWSAADITNTEKALHEIRQQASVSQCVAIGEIGLDYCKPVPKDIQKQIFTSQIQLAEQLNLPIIIHCVKAWNDLLDIHKRLSVNVPCIVHGFRGKPELASQLIKKKFYLSFGVRHNSESLKICPVNRLFLETDEDEYPIAALYQTAAVLHTLSTEEMKAQCWRNFQAIKTGKPEKGV